ncbi:MAG TPA: hypothetical protein VF063_10610 [Gaiellaceae bacterium]
MEDSERWAWLYANPAVLDLGWFPPTEEVPELADLRRDHARLLAARAEATQEVFRLKQQREREQEAASEAMTAAYLAGDEPDGKLPKPKVTDDVLAAAERRALAATDALQRFCQNAIKQVAEREPDLLLGLDKIIDAAKAKRDEAQALLDEAARMEASTKKLRNWLGRATGKSALGLFPYEQMATPGPDSADMTVRELWEATNPTPSFEPVELADGLDPNDAGLDDGRPAIETIDLDAEEEPAHA